MSYGGVGCTARAIPLSTSPMPDTVYTVPPGGDTPYTGRGGAYGYQGMLSLGEQFQLVRPVSPVPCIRLVLTVPRGGVYGGAFPGYLEPKGPSTPVYQYPPVEAAFLSHQYRYSPRGVGAVRGVYRELALSWNACYPVSIYPCAPTPPPASPVPWIPVSLGGTGRGGYI